MSNEELFSLIVIVIIVTGSIAYDYIMEFPGKFGEHILPEHTHNINLSFIVNKFAKRLGGTAGNVSYTMGLLNTPHILYSVAGYDFGDYKKAFQKIGIDISHVAIDKEQRTATGFAMADSMQNQIWGYYYGAASKNSILQLSKVAKKKDLVLIGPQGAEGSMHFVKECIALQIPYMFDPGFILTQVESDDLQTGLENAAYVIGNEYEMNLMKERVSSFAHIMQQRIAITTLGDKGAVILEKGKEYRIGPVKIDKVASTTGAGDAWRGGFLAGLQKGYGLQICGQMGAVASSFAVEYFGTQEHHYTLAEFIKRYTDCFSSKLVL